MSRAFHKRGSLKTKAGIAATLFFAPFVLFYLYPVGSSAIFSLTSDTTGNFAGLSNYASLLSNEYFKMALKNSMVFTVISTPVLVVFAFVIACLLFVSNKLIKLIRGVFLVPILVPSTALVLFWRVAFAAQSDIHTFLLQFGESVPLLVPLYCFFIWKNAGLLAVIIMSGIAKIPEEIFDAAQVDGAGFVKKHFYITLPLIAKVLFFSLILGIVQSFKIFKEVYLLYGSYPEDSLYFIQHYTTNKFQKLAYSELSAGAMMFTICLMLMIGGVFLAAKKAGKRL